MNILVTAGNTLTPIDRVRCITNIFSGRTGTQIALHAHSRGHEVALLTSHPDMVDKLLKPTALPNERWCLETYRTFDELQRIMEARIRLGDFDALIHSAAVSDYQSGGIFAANQHSAFHAETGQWRSETDEPPALVDRAAGKVKSDAPELWLRLVRTPKLIDMVRSLWNFHGVLVKFKLEVGVSEAELLNIAERSRRQSAADLIAANTLEGMNDWALLGPLGGSYQRINRPELASLLLDALEHLHRERGHG